MRSIYGYTGFLMLMTLLWPNVIYAQKADTVVSIPGLKILAPSLIGDEADSIDISNVAGFNSIPAVLRSQSNIYFRDFGPGSSSTISIFGSKPNEVALVWNGIKVANPMLGVNDYSMISAADMTSLRVARVGSSTIYGAGSGAGAILMDQNIDEADHNVEVSAGWSSLNRFSGTAAHMKSQGKWKHRTSLSGLTGKNNFRYTTHDGNEERLPNARSKFLSASHHSVFQVRPHQYWTASLWCRKQHREIPPTLTEPRSEAAQSDAFIRSVVQYHDLKPQHRINVKAYFGYQNQQYQNPRIKLDARHRFKNAQLRMDNQWQPRPDIFIKYGLLNNFFSAQSDNYSDIHRQNRLSAYIQTGYEFNQLPLELTGLIQPERVSMHKVGWTAELKLKYQQGSIGDLVLFANQNIVWPTLNDLYWNPGGNPDLIPEKNRMTGLIWKKGWLYNLQSKVTMYYRKAENWIKWTPTDLGFWRPYNAKEGRSYGILMESKYDIRENIKLRGGYQYVRTYILNDTPLREQAIYTPAHMWSLRGEHNIRGRWTLYVTGEYISTRYVTRDHSDALEPYLLLHTGIQYSLKHHRRMIGLQVRNALNADYQGVKNRPMPGRQFEINTQFKF